MRIGHDLNAKQRSSSECRIYFVFGFALIVSSAGCSALNDYGDFKFGPGKDQKTDAGAGDSGPAADGGEVDSGSGEPAGDGGGNTERDAAAADGGGEKGDAATSDAAAADGGEDAGVDAGMSSCPGAVEICDNGIDDDCDDQADCADFDCVNFTTCCKRNQVHESTCSGGVDNDCDGLVDCADPDCYSAPSCCLATGFEVGVAACDDGVDNDCDGITDCADNACAGVKSCCTGLVAENTTPLCNDGKDNDCDGFVDCQDSDCATKAACCTVMGTEQGGTNNLNCKDNKDNDCDGLVDCRDPDCSALPACVCNRTAITEVGCSDAYDNDCDKDKDCRDLDCIGASTCCVSNGPENTASACVDGRDNDCDGFTDCTDSDCATQNACCVATGAENSAAACNDGKDNDCDMKVDCADDNCAGTSACCSATGTENNLIACTDGVDNDCDGKLDCTDPDCAGITACCAPAEIGSVTTAVSCCTADNKNDLMQPNDGKDNECDGLTDVAQLQAAFPIQGLPAPADAVWLTMKPELDAKATLECSTHRPGKTAAFKPCPRQEVDAAKIAPFRGVDPAQAENNGLWTTEVRWKFPNGKRSQVFEFRYYVHSSLAGVDTCTPKYADDKYFMVADTLLGVADAGTFLPNVDTFLANPFVRVKYKVPVSGNVIYGLNGESPSVDMWSLRKRFRLDSSNHYLLATRSYRATRSPTCTVASLAIHTTDINHDFRNIQCQAIVMNRAGVGVCLSDGTTAPEIVAVSNDSYANALGWPKANKFMWRNFVRKHNGNYVNFTEKCATPGCTTTYLPDRDKFGP